MRRNTYFRTGYRTASSFTGRIVSKCTTRRAVTSARWTLNKKQDSSMSRSKVKVKYAKNTYFRTGYRTASSFTGRIVSKCSTRRAVTPARWTLNKKQDSSMSRSKVKVKYAKNTYFRTGYRTASSFTGRIVSKCTTRRAGTPARWTLNKKQDSSMSRSKVKVKYAKKHLF